MKKVMLLTIVIGTLLAFLIFKLVYHEDINITTIGDSLSLGYTAYETKGYSFNDYLRDYYEENSHIEEYITEFSSPKETSQTLLLKLENNYSLEESNLSITQAISKSTILTIAIGMDELNQNTKLNREEIEEYLKNMNRILKLIRINNKKKIFLLGIYQTKKISKTYVEEINNRLEELCQEQHIHFIDIKNLLSKKEYFFDNNSYLINYKGHKYISDKLIEELK